MGWVWQHQDPTDGVYHLASGHRYAGLASVTTKGTLQTIVDKVSAKGLEVTYAWEEGQPTRGRYVIDDWLAGLPPDSRDGERWVYLEGNAHADADVDRDKSFLWLDVYHVAHLYMATEQADAPPDPAPPAPPDVPVLPPPASSAPYALGAAGAVLAAFLLLRSKR